MKTNRLVVLLLIGMVVASFSVSAQNKYVGVKMCSICHKTEKQGKQFDIWQKSKHAGAYKTLTTAKANEIAKSKGISKPAAEASECLECHAKARDVKEASYDVKDGVQCETCHGAGSAYKILSVMKDKAKAVAAGLTDFKDADTIEKFCKTCHNERSPNFKEFKFEEMWGKIKHSVPKG